MTSCVYVRGECDDFISKSNEKIEMNRVHDSHKVYGIGICEVCFISEEHTYVRFQGAFNGCGMDYLS